MSATPDVLTVGEVAALLRCGPKAVRRLCKLKTLPSRVIDQKGTVRIHRSAVEAFLLGQRAGGR